ncbi:MAG TPA: hypothetical protein VFS43_44385 [Polyangiaceae bacterium]|nr:hypothetical protein [Polyangiaceae bacterium]
MAGAARGLVKGDEAAWQAFVASVEGADLGPPVRAMLQNPPSSCSLAAEGGAP